jgi:hypothetical protein
LILLPISLNYPWKNLHEKNVKVRVFIEIPSEDSIHGEQGTGEKLEGGNKPGDLDLGLLNK